MLQGQWVPAQVLQVHSVAEILAPKELKGLLVEAGTGMGPVKAH